MAVYLNVKVDKDTINQRKSQRANRNSVMYMLQRSTVQIRKSIHRSHICAQSALIVVMHKIKTTLRN